MFRKPDVRTLYSLSFYFLKVSLISAIGPRGSLGGANGTKYKDQCSRETGIIAPWGHWFQDITYCLFSCCCLHFIFQFSPILARQALQE